MKRQMLETIARFLIGASLFAPLIVLPGSFVFPFIVPKILFFRAMTLFLFGTYLLLLLIDWERYRPQTNLTTIATGLFLLSGFLSTVLGVDWYRSLWDNHERMLGFFTIAHYCLYYLILSSILTDWKAWRKYLWIFLFVGSIIMLFGAWQVYGDSAFLLNRGKGRVSSTLGNAIYFSGFGLYLFVLGIFLAFREKKGSWMQRMAIAGAALGFGGIFWGGTRGTFLGLLAGGATYLLFLFVSDFGNRRMRNIVLTVVGITLTLGVAAYIFRFSPVVQSIAPVRRLVTMDLGSIQKDTRVMAWGIAVESWKKYPIFGWGPNNFFYAFDLYYRPEFLEHGYPETWFDNAHSAIFNTLAVQGLFGLLTYLFLFVAPIVMLIQAFRGGRLDRQSAALSVAFLVAHFVHNATVFENPTSYLYFFFFLALVVNLAKEKNAPAGEKKRMPDGVISSGMAWSVVLVVLLFVYVTDINPARANNASLDVIMALGQDPQAAMDLYKKAGSIPSPHVDDIRADFARNAVDAATAYYNAGKKDEAIALLELGEEELQKNLTLHPMDIRTHLLYTQIAQSHAAITKNPILLARADQLIEGALQFSPKRQQLLVTLSVIKEQLGDEEVSRKLLEQMIDLDPAIGEGWWRLAYWYAHRGMRPRAFETIDKARKSGVVFTDTDEKIIAEFIVPTSTSSIAK